jgi:glutamate synthase domain-containing protein 2
MPATGIKQQNKTKIANWSELADRQPTYALVGEVDLVVIRYDDQASVMYGRCLHRGALMSDGHVDGDNLFCAIHNWDYRIDSGVSEYNNSEALHKFTSWIEGDGVYVEDDEVKAFQQSHPQPFHRDEYLGLYQDVHGSPEEPHNGYIQMLARKGKSGIGHHGPVTSMGVPTTELPQWSDIQIITAQLARQPLLDAEPVDTKLVIGPAANKPLELEIPLFVSDMSFGALSEEAKVALATGAELAGTGICSGEGGMLPDEQAANSRYFYELASARFGYSLDKVARCQAFHFKAGQGAKTGTGGHLPGKKVVGKIAEVRGLKPGEDAISPSRFPDFNDIEAYQDMATEVRQRTDGIPIGVKMSAQHIEEDIDFALEIGIDYIIIDGRGGGTGAAPNVFKNNISVPTMAAIPRARKRLDSNKLGKHVTLIATGGLRTESDFVKALGLGADGVAISNSAMQAIGCLGMRACSTNNCPVGIATQKEALRARLKIRASAERLKNFFEASTQLMVVLARACGHRHLQEFNPNDLTTWKREIADLTGIMYAGVSSGE